MDSYFYTKTSIQLPSEKSRYYKFCMAKDFIEFKFFYLYESLWHEKLNLKNLNHPSSNFKIHTTAIFFAKNTLSRFRLWYTIYYVIIENQLNLCHASWQSEQNSRELCIQSKFTCIYPENYLLVFVKCL